jgi:hypothetical protein
MENDLTKTVPQLELMTAPPADPMLREQIGNDLWVALVIRFDESLSEQDRTLWRNPPPNVLPGSQHARLVDLFDEYLVRQFADRGLRLLMSLDVVRRLAQWEIHRPDLCARVGEMMELKSKVFRGEKSAQFPDDLDVFADKAIPELGRLLRIQRDVFAQRPIASCERIAEWMKLTIQERPAEFPELHAHLGQLHGFVATLPRRNPDAARILERGDIRPEGFFYQWYSACTNRNAKDVRNRISELRNER